MKHYDDIMYGYIGTYFYFDTIKPLPNAHMLMLMFSHTYSVN